MSKITTAAMLGAFAFAFTAAPAAFDPSSATLSVSQALAKHGADDATDNVSGEGETRGGGKRNDDVILSKHGADDATDNTSGEGETRGGGGKRNDDVILSKGGADDAVDTHEDGPRGRGRGTDDGANHG